MAEDSGMTYLEDVYSIRDSQERSTEPVTGTIRVAILDDHPATAEGYRARLDIEPDFEVIKGETLAESGILKNRISLKLPENRSISLQIKLK